MNPIPILFRRSNPAAKIPHRASEHAACFDLYAATTHVDNDNQVLVCTGIHTAFPENHVLLVYGRSGLAFKHGIRLANGVGVIDADYRGEIRLAFRSDQVPLLEVARLLSEGERVAQCMLVPLPVIEWTEVDTLPDSVRGEGGFGSTGSK